MLRSLKHNWGQTTKHTCHTVDRLEETGTILQLSTIFHIEGRDGILNKHLNYSGVQHSGNFLKWRWDRLLSWTEVSNQPHTKRAIVCTVQKLIGTKSLSLESLFSYCLSGVCFVLILFSTCIICCLLFAFFLFSPLTEHRASSEHRTKQNKTKQKTVCSCDENWAKINNSVLTQTCFLSISVYGNQPVKRITRPVPVSW